VTSAEVVKRNLLGSGGSTGSFIKHKGLCVTTADGKKYLIHSTNTSSAQVITEAKHMSRNWETVENLVPRGSPTVGALMETAKKNGGYNLYGNNCWNTVNNIKDRHFK
jgi:hypothetical protein